MAHVLITGASSGIGHALARRFARDGHRLTLVARRPGPMHALAAEVAVPVHVVSADLAEPSVVPEVLAEARSAHGAVDVLVNNAGIQYVELAAGVGPERIDRLLAVNLRTPLHLMHHALADMPAGGAIVNIASMAAVNPPAGMAHYAASKAGLAAASEAMRVELAPRDVHVLTVYPGPVATPMERAARDRLDQGVVARVAPSGTADALAERIVRALARRRGRLFYPRSYALSWWLGGVAQWVAEVTVPRPKA